MASLQILSSFFLVCRNRILNLKTCFVFCCFVLLLHCFGSLFLFILAFCGGWNKVSLCGTSWPGTQEHHPSLFPAPWRPRAHTTKPGLMLLYLCTDFQCQVVCIGVQLHLTVGSLFWWFGYLTLSLLFEQCVGFNRPWWNWECGQTVRCTGSSKKFWNVQRQLYLTRRNRRIPELSQWYEFDYSI